MTRFALALVAMMSPALASAEMITKTSAYSVTETVDRLTAAVEGAGATVFARIDHAKGAAKVGSDLRPTQMLMFGNPKLGTPAMQASQTAGLDLPLRVVVYQTEGGDVLLSYHDPAAMGATHGLPADAPVLKRMAGALDKLTGKAVGK